jgi:hypothetical protein
MTAEQVASLVVLAALVIGAAPLWGDLRPRPPLRLRSRAGIVLVVGGTALVVGAVLALDAPAAHGAGARLAAALALAAAVVGGGPVAAAVLRLADQGRQVSGPGPADPTVLHGGAWIGALERIAVAGSLLAGWPEGIAVALAVKGLGRYPELRVPAASERFIIGTFASVLWAAASAGVGLALLR